MTLVWNERSGTYECDFRAVGIKRLHLSLSTDKKREAQQRHDAVHVLVKQRRTEMIDQLRARILTVERVAAMVQGGEPLVPLPVSAEIAGRATSDWMTVDEAVKGYLGWMTAHQNKRASSVKIAKSQLNQFVAYEHQGTRIGSLPLDRVPSAAIRGYQQSLIVKFAPSTVTVYMTRPGALWRWAIAHEQRISREEQRAAKTLYSPVDSDTLHRETDRRDRVLTPDEARLLIARTPKRLLFPVACGLLAGLRIGEMLHLRPGLDVDLELGVIHIREKPEWKPKTKRSKRLIPMATELHALAKAHAAAYASESWMVPSPVMPVAPLSQDTILTQFRAIVVGAGMIYGQRNRQGVVFHTLRHSFASHAVMNGVDLYTVAKLLGDSLKMVEDVYADLSPDYKRAAIGKLANALKLNVLTQQEPQ